MRHLLRPVTLSMFAILLAGGAHAQSLGGFGRPMTPANSNNIPSRSEPMSAPTPQNSPRRYTPSMPGGVSSSSVFPQLSPGQNSSPGASGTLPPRRVWQRPTEPINDHRPTATIRTYSNQGYSNQSSTNYPGHYNSNAPVFGSRAGQQSVRVTTPVGPRQLPYGGYDNNGYYNNGYPVYGGSTYTVVNGPPMLGGYYYSNYTSTYAAQNCYPSIYSAYSGFPEYIYSPASVVVVASPYFPVYVTGYVPFYTPSYPVVYNENIYYVGSQQRAEQIVTGDDETRRAALRTAYPEGSFQAAFGDIERAWADGNLALLRKHLRADDVKLSVFFKNKYSYSIASSDFLQITRDAFDRLTTISFKFDRLRKAKNGDVTAYGTHVYRVSSGVSNSSDSETIPFSTDGSSNGPADTDNSSSGSTASGTEKTITVSYTLHRQGDQWNIIAIDSTPADSAK